VGHPAVRPLRHSHVGPRSQCRRLLRRNHTSAKIRATQRQFRVSLVTTGCASSIYSQADPSFFPFHHRHREGGGKKESERRQEHQFGVSARRRKQGDTEFTLPSTSSAGVRIGSLRRVAARVVVALAGRIDELSDLNCSSEFGLGAAPPCTVNGDLVAV
jgi:hypothetical protein